MDLADSAQVPRVQVQVPKSNELELGLRGLELKLHEVPTTDSSQVRRDGKSVEISTDEYSSPK